MFVQLKANRDVPPHNEYNIGIPRHDCESEHFAHLSASTVVDEYPTIEHWFLEISRVSTTSANSAQPGSSKQAHRYSKDSVSSLTLAAKTIAQGCE